VKRGHDISAKAYFKGAQPFYYPTPKNVRLYQDLDVIVLFINITA
jgi:hypothetical protein